MAKKVVTNFTPFYPGSLVRSTMRVVDQWMTAASGADQIVQHAWAVSSRHKSSFKIKKKYKIRVSPIRKRGSVTLRLTKKNHKSRHLVYNASNGRYYWTKLRLDKAIEKRQLFEAVDRTESASQELGTAFGFRIPARVLVPAAIVLKSRANEIMACSLTPIDGSYSVQADAYLTISTCVFKATALVDPSRRVFSGWNALLDHFKSVMIETRDQLHPTYADKYPVANLHDDVVYTKAAYTDIVQNGKYVKFKVKEYDLSPPADHDYSIVMSLVGSTWTCLGALSDLPSMIDADEWFGWFTSGGGLVVVKKKTGKDDDLEPVERRTAEEVTELIGGAVDGTVVELTPDVLEAFQLPKSHSVALPTAGVWSMPVAIVFQMIKTFLEVWMASFDLDITFVIPTPQGSAAATTAAEIKELDEVASIDLGDDYQPSLW